MVIPFMKAEVILHLGRYFLVVGGIYVAMESDPCRDPAFDGKTWTESMLRTAAGYINANLWLSAQQRLDSERSDSPD
jgi:hypothetical protein